VSLLFTGCGDSTESTTDTGTGSGGDAISITTPTWLRGEWKHPGDSSVCLNVTETEINLSTDVASSGGTCPTPTAISVASVVKNEGNNYELTLAVDATANQCNFVRIPKVDAIPPAPAIEESLTVTCTGHNFSLTGLKK